MFQEFNRGIFDYLIATDSAKKPDSKAQEDGPRGGGKQGKKRKHAELDGEFGVIRGVDFKGVETVINADAPSSVQRSSSLLIYNILALLDAMRTRIISLSQVSA